MSQPEQPGWRWGPFTFRLPFYHSKLCWPELVQGLLIAAATGLSLVPLMTSFFGLSFEEAVAVSMIHSALNCLGHHCFRRTLRPRLDYPRVAIGTRLCAWRV